MTFDAAAFDENAFDSADSAVYSAAMPLVVTVALAPISYSSEAFLSVSVADSRSFDTDLFSISWSVRVIVGVDDFTSRLVGSIKIDASEDAARIASLSLIPMSSAQLAALEGATVSIDISVIGGGYTATRRRFTGVVESVVFSAATRVATLQCRDGYQDRIRAANSVSAAQALLGGLDTVSPKILAWNDAEPDPAGYFSAALDTVPGATFIDGAGVWRVVPWHLGSPVRTYSAADMFDPGPVVETAQRAELPAAVVATLTHRFVRLHNVEVTLNWEEPDRVNYVTRGIPSPAKSMVADAIDGLGDWVVKDEATLTSPAPGVYPVWDGSQTTYYVVSHEAAPFLIRTMSATMYRRWYQEVDRTYQVTVSLGGASERDESVSRGITSTFDAASWESGRRSDPSLGIYSANAPAGAEDDPVPTGYEALEAPWPPANGAIDHFGDLSTDDIRLACRHVVAEATRTAAAWRRRQRVSFERPADLRLEIGDVVGVNAYGVAATGQVAAWSEDYDLESGACVGTYTLAAPAGAGAATAFEVDVTILPPSVAHAPLAPPLENWIGADSNTPSAWIPPDSIAGYLCNTLPTSDFYNAGSPTYETQFRIVLPEISADVRDPATETVDMSATISLADAGLIITF